MRISQFPKINFRSCDRIVYRKKDGSRYGFEDIRQRKIDSTDVFDFLQSTSFFRFDLEDSNSHTWENFIKTISNNFKDDKKVNVYDFGCSDGSEVYSLIAKLTNDLGHEEADKFFPVKCFDIDKEIIDRAKTGEINAYFEDHIFIRKNLGNNSEKFFYFMINKEISSNYLYAVYIKNNVKQYAQFETGDFTKEIDKINCSNYMTFICIISTHSV